jgi:tRNA pseudouridine55 synthase
MGQSLGCGAHLQSLRRTAAAEFTLADARTLEQVQQAVDQSLDPTTDRTLNSASIPQVTPGSPAVSQYEDLFVHPRRLLPQFPSVTADEANTARIRSGRPVNLPELSQSRQVKVFSGQRELIAIATRIAGTLFHAGIVFAP